MTEENGKKGCANACVSECKKNCGEFVPWRGYIGGFRFERRASHVVFDPVTSSFVATWAKCGRSQNERISARKDPWLWMPSVFAVATLYERGCVPHGQTVFAARAVGRALDAGDRDMLDTDGALKAAERVRDISYKCQDLSSPIAVRGVEQAMRSLLDEIAVVRLFKVAETDFDEWSVMSTIEKTISRCLSSDGFLEWPPSAMRRRFMFCLNRRERTLVIYTLASLAFDVGVSPLLSSLDKRMLRMRAAKTSGLLDGLSRESLTDFFRVALSMMREIRSSRL